MVTLYVRAPNNQVNTVEAKQRHDELLHSFGASFRAPHGVPEQDADGTWEVRVFPGGSPLNTVEEVLTEHCGLEIVLRA